eukprot:TRINITY_DN5911_c0_g1_i2.p1 TRINITY_DN5911_c0_g1~~TRINITY_DN5911_c0_g1_i2.p1  ORF type:complete len:274 (-),score=91.89 TRINITY_DN5911_c0_g1_i2:313-1134(-)
MLAGGDEEGEESGRTEGAVACLLAERLANNASFLSGARLTPRHAHRLFLAATVVAVKLLHDDCGRDLMRCAAVLGGVCAREVALLEVAFLMLTTFDVMVYPGELYAFCERCCEEDDAERVEAGTQRSGACFYLLQQQHEPCSEVPTQSGACFEENCAEQAVKVIGACFHSEKEEAEPEQPTHKTSGASFYRLQKHECCREVEDTQSGERGGESIAEQAVTIVACFHHETKEVDCCKKENADACFHRETEAVEAECTTHKTRRARFYRLQQQQH